MFFCNPYELPINQIINGTTTEGDIPLSINPVINEMSQSSFKAKAKQCNYTHSDHCA